MLFKTGRTFELGNVHPKSSRLRGATELGLNNASFVPKVWSLRIIFLASFLFLLLWIRLEVNKREDWSKRAVSNYTFYQYVLPPRGIIYDAQGRPLVYNYPTFDLYLDKRKTRERETEQLLSLLSEVLSLSPQELLEKILSSSDNEVLLKEDLSDQEIAKLEVLRNSFQGLEIRKSFKRFYVKGESLFPVLGYAGKPSKEDLVSFPELSLSDLVGKAGLERYYQEVLAGKKGKTVIVRDARGEVLKREKVQEAIAGKDLRLFLDLDLQEVFYKALKDKVEELGAKGGAGVILDVKTGGVKALVSYPSADPNRFKEQQYLQEVQEDKRAPFLNRAIAGRYPTGSVIKPLLGALALREGVITPNTIIDDTKGYIVVPNPWFPDQPWIFRDWRAHGLVDIRKALAVSCNVFFYTVGGGYGEIRGLGIEKISEFLSDIGWDKKTGIDLPGEKAGQVPSPAWKKEVFGERAIWLPGDTYNLSIGQGYLLATPLEVAFSYFYLLDTPYIFPPRLVQDREVPRIENNLFSLSEKRVILEGMRQAVTQGSALLLKKAPVPVAAKTGTAETGKEGVWQAWVVVLAPYPDPEIVLLVTIEEAPQGSISTLPVALEVLDFYFSQKE